MSKTGKQKIGIGMLVGLLFFIAVAILPFGRPSAALPIGTNHQASRIPHLHQSSQANDANGAAANWIDGAQHPELIPDSTAYRLYFIAVSTAPIPTPTENARQRRQLGMAGLKDNDIQATAPVLASFKSQYATLIDEYNKSPEVASGSSAHLVLFLAKREALVQATRDALKEALTSEGLTNLHAHVMRQKSKMKVAKEVQ